MGKVLTVFTLAMLVCASLASSQPSDSKSTYDVPLSLQPRFMVDFPTAGLSPKGGFYVDADIYGEGGVLLYLGVGFARYFSFGISYGGLRIIGSGDPEMNPQPGVQLKARIVEESYVVPAIVLGFDSQGRGATLRSFPMAKPCACVAVIVWPYALTAPWIMPRWPRSSRRFPANKFNTRPCRKRPYDHHLPAASAAGLLVAGPGDGPWPWRL